MAISETTLLLRLPKHLKKEIQAEARRKSLSVNGLVRLALIQWLRQESLKAKLEEDVAKRKAKG